MGVVETLRSELINKGSISAAVVPDVTLEDLDSLRHDLTFVQNPEHLVHSDSAIDDALKSDVIRSMKSASLQKGPVIIDLIASCLRLAVNKC